MKMLKGMGLLSVCLIAATHAVAGGKTPSGAISMHAAANGAFDDKGGYVTNGKVNFADGGAMRALSGAGNDHASAESAVDVGNGDGTRVEPRGLVGD